jgi:uncharacterized membrane protein
MQLESQMRDRARNGYSRSQAWQKWGMVLGGSALAVYALMRRKQSGVALAAAGGLLAYRGARLESQIRKYKARASFAVNCSPEQAYQYWRNFENLPRFMRHLESVRTTGDRQSEWVAIGPLNSRLHWRAEIVDERPNEFIAWRSLPESEFENSGYVRFRTAPGDRGTIITVTMRYEPLGGALGKAAAGIFGKNPQFTVREDLRRFKSLMEAGEIPTTEGQPHGPRSAVVSGLHRFYAARPKTSEFHVAQQMAAERRAS